MARSRRLDQFSLGNRFSLTAWTNSEISEELKNFRSILVYLGVLVWKLSHHLHYLDSLINEVIQEASAIWHFCSAIMTHVLTNLGYPHDLRFRSKSAEIFREHERRKEGIPKTEFDKIRSLSRQSWQRSWENPGDPLPSVKCNHFVTTYSTTHNYKALQEPTPCRQTSPTRRNNPHPTRSVSFVCVKCKHQ